MVNPDERLEIVLTTEDQMQESLIVGELKNARIKYVVRSFDDSAFDGVISMHFGHSQILVLEHDIERAKEVIREVLSKPE